MADVMMLIKKEQETIPKMLKRAGYTTAAFGKWHIGWDWPYKDGKTPRKKDSTKMDFSGPIPGGPLGAGFDYYFGVDQPLPNPRCYMENNNTVGTPTELDTESSKNKLALKVKDWDVYKSLPTITDRVEKYIDGRGKKAEEPFFIYFALTTPHKPLTPAPEFAGKSAAGPYGDLVLQSDHSVGVVLNALKRNGFEENTLVIYSSDNGSPAKNSGVQKGTIFAETGHNPNAHFRGVKGDAWEGGHRVPFLAKWPKNIPAGKINKQLICQVDLLATFAAITKQDYDKQWAVDSENMLDFLKGGKGRASLVAMSQALFHVRQGKWKLLLGGGSGDLSDSAIDYESRQLYDMEKDPSEKTNLASQYPEIVQRLEALVTSERAKTSVEFPERTGSKGKKSSKKGKKKKGL